MILGMVSYMPPYGLIVKGQADFLFSIAYFKAWLANFVVALPYQLLILGPFSRNILRRVQTSVFQE